jgi:hypothetical protein
LIFRGICFELIKYFFQIPALAVEQDDEAGGEFHFVGEVWPGLTAIWISPGDATDGAAGAGGGDPFVAGDNECCLAKFP